MPRRLTQLPRGAGLVRLALCAITAALGCGEERDPRPAHVVLVSQAGSTTLAAIDPERPLVAKRIQVGQLPHRLVRNRAGTAVYAVLVGSQAIAEIDGRTLELRRTLLTAPVPRRGPTARRAIPVTASSTTRSSSHKTTRVSARSTPVQSAASVPTRRSRRGSTEPRFKRLTTPAHSAA